MAANAVVARSEKKRKSCNEGEWLARRSTRSVNGSIRPKIASSESIASLRKGHKPGTMKAARFSDP